LAISATVCPLGLASIARTTRCWRDSWSPRIKNPEKHSPQSARRSQREFKFYSIKPNIPLFFSFPTTPCELPLKTPAFSASNRCRVTDLWAGIYYNYFNEKTILFRDLWCSRLRLGGIIFLPDWNLGDR
jgi:hypothetical protein